MSELTDLLERFRRGPELIAVATTGASNVEMDFAPAPGSWSVRQICCHVSDSDVVGAYRMRAVIAEENPTLMGYDEKKWAVNLDYDKRRVSEALETFRHMRAETYALLKSLPEGAFQRTGNHSERGPLTLLDLLRIYAQHAEKHSQQIMRARQSYKESKAGS
jgi:hypothetical protein